MKWVKPSKCISFSAWLEWECREPSKQGTFQIFHRFLGFEWITKGDKDE